MKVSPEPIVLTIALVVLAGAAIGLALTFPAVQDITGVTSVVPNGKTPPKMKPDEIETRLAGWQAPTPWADSAHPLFKSEGFIFYPDQYPDGQYLKKVDPNVRTPTGVLISWYQKYGLDFTDPNVDREDPDNDGFSNIVEFKNEQAKAEEGDGSKSTNPRDPQSHPSYLSRLRLQKYDSQPFHIQFRGYQELGGAEEFQIFLRDEPSYQQPGLKKTGDPLGFGGYVVGAFHKDIVTKVNQATGSPEQVDDSTLELDRPDIGFKITLLFRQETDSPESTADFVMLMPTEVDKSIKVARGKTFSVPFVTASTYLLIAVDKTGATVQNTETKQNIQVPLLDPKEWSEVPNPADNPAAGKTPRP